MTDLIATYPWKPEIRAEFGDAQGDYGTLVAGSFACDFLFRLRYVRLPAGVYVAEFSRMGAERDGARCIRVLDAIGCFEMTEKQAEVLDADTLCIHAAQHVSQLKGCMAPLLHRAPSGAVAGNSTTTLGALFAALGGHTMGKRLVLEVNNE